MEPTNDSRRPEAAAADKTAGPGGNSTEEPAKNGTVQSGAPRSWRQYIEQTLPAKDTNQAAQPREADLLQFASPPKKRARSAWERFTRRTARWARENGKKARAAAGAAREKLGQGMRKVHTAVARHPVSPLLYVTLLAVFIGAAAFQGSYARAYVLEVNHQKLGLVTGKD